MVLRALWVIQVHSEISPGVHDIHSRRVPDTAEMLRLRRKVAEVILP